MTAPRPEHLRRIRRKLSDDGVCSTECAAALTGADPFSALESLAASGLAIQISRNTYRDPRLSEDDPRVIDALRLESGNDASARRVVDRMSADLPAPQHAILRLWYPPEREERAPLKRIYISLPGYPPFFAQQRRIASDAPSDILWDSAHHTLGPREAELLGRTLFPSPRLCFSDIAEALGDEREKELTIPDSASGAFGSAPLPPPVSPHMHHTLPCAYVVSDADSLDPTRLKHPIPETVVLQASACQPAVLVNTLRKVPNLAIVESPSQLVHFTVPGRLAASRLTAEDFEDMLQNGTTALMEMAERLSDTGLHRCLIIEGGPFASRTFPLARLASSLSYIQNVHRIHIVPTMNQRHSIYALVQTIKHSVFGLTEDALGKPVATTVAERASGITALHMLRAIPGISAAKAEAISKVFPDLQSIALATQEELMRVDGIGRALADSITSCFRTSFHADKPA